VSCAKTAKPIEMPFGIWTQVGPRKHVLDGDADWRHLANATEPSVCCGDAALCQITFTTFSHVHPVVFDVSTAHRLPNSPKIISDHDVTVFNSTYLTSTVS